MGSSDDSDAATPETVTATSIDDAAATEGDPVTPAGPQRDRPGLGAGLPPIREDRYEIRGVHGRGGIGVVFEAYDRTLKRRVALKELQSYGPRSQARFVREALITARLDHPCIVSVYEAGTWPDGRAIYAMKMVEGRSLKEELACAATPAERLSLIPHVIAVADAVAYAHSKGIIHRDLKPANVIVGEFGETVVIDWGLAKDLGAEDDDSSEPVVDGDDQLTKTGALMGTPAYMAPEQFAGGPVDQRARPLDRYVGRWRGLYRESCRDTYWRGSQSHQLLDRRTQCLEQRRAELAALSARLSDSADAATLQKAAGAVEQLVPIDYCRDPNNLRADSPPPATPAVAEQRARVRGELARARAQRLTGDYAGAKQRILGLLGRESDIEPYLMAKLQLELGTAQSLLAEADAASDAFESAYLAALHQQNSQVLLEASAGRVEVSARNGRFGDADHWEKLLLARIDIATDPRAQVRGLRALGVLEVARGNVSKAVELYQRAVDDSDAAAYPVEHAESMLDLGRTIFDGGLRRTPGYQHYFERAYQLLVSELGAEHPETLRALAARPDEAALREALGVDDRLQVMPVRVRLRAMNDLARILVRAHRFDEAVDILDRARTLAVDRLGEASVELSGIYNLFGNLHYKKGELVDAQAANLQRLHILEQVVGENHPLIASAHNNIGLLENELGHPDEAMRHFKRALQIYAREPTGLHGRRGNTLNNMAGIAEDNDRIEEAIDLYLQSARERQLASGPIGNSAGDSYTNLGDLLRGQKRYDEAEKYQRRALAIYEKAHAAERAETGREHPDLAWPLTALGEIALERDRPREALPYLERAERIRREGNVAPRWLGRTQFYLAKAVWRATHDRRRARQLITAAAATYRRGQTDRDRAQLKEVAAWRRATGL